MMRIFGFDIGTTSIGSAVIDYDRQQGRGEILRLGVRIFPEARDADGTPLNQTRRIKRLMRRQLRRRRLRRRALNEALLAAGLLPAYGTSDWQAVIGRDPVALRARGLSERLEPHEVGRALYHLAKRRHFKGRELADEDEQEAAEDNETKQSADSVTTTLKASGQTLGQFLAEKGPRDRQRGLHANRSDVTAEFGRLWDAQAVHHPTLRDPVFRGCVADVIFSQRPVFWRKNTLGKCRFMPGEALCPKGSWLSQQRRMLEKLNNLALAGGNARPLDAEERAAILEKLQTQASMSWPGVRAALRPLFKKRGDPGGERGLKFNLEVGGDRALLGNATEAKLTKIFGNGWERQPHRQAIRDAVHERLWSADYGEVGDQRVVILSDEARRKRRAAAAQSFLTDFHISAEQGVALRDLRLPTGWEPYSTAALRQFLPELENGVRFGALVNGPEWEGWRAQSFPNRDRPTGEVLDRLPSPASKEEQRRIVALRNPTVIRTQNELRKVVNNLIGLYGKPDLIRIELARQVGKSKREREEMQAGIRNQEKRRKAAASDLISKGIALPSRSDVEKWLLWKECGEFDPYSGKPVSFDALFRTGEFDVEHIWPRWKSFDDSYGNKTLCLKSLNLRKTNKTPFGAFDGDPEWPQMKARVWQLVKDGKMKPGKAKRFCREQPLDDDFASRQLNDTGFAARQAVAFLKRLWPDVGITASVTVQPVTGRVTAQLRRLWGLNNILSDDGEKTRTDHRHHAIDALVVACAHPGISNELSRYWQAEDDPNRRAPVLDPPWPTIRADAERASDEIIVSHRVRKKVSGPLHQEMPLGYTKKDVIKNGTEFGIFVKRMPVGRLSLETLKIGRVEEITRSANFVVADETVREALVAHLERTDLPPAKAYPPYPIVSSGGPEIRKVRVLMLQQKKLMVRASTGFADPASNHHIAIFRLPNGKAVSDPPVSLYQAVRRLSRREPLVCRRRDDGAEFVMSLSAGDAIEIQNGGSQGIWIVQSIWASGVIETRSHTDAGRERSDIQRFTPGSLLAAHARKASIDPIGRLRPAND